MFTANVYRIMIGCPSDIHEEVKSAINVIFHWTNLHAESRGIVLLPIHWATNAYPELGSHPQTILNEQLASKSDMLICIFGARVGTPTGKSQSGTIEEIEEHIKAGKPVMLFFRRQNDISISASEIEALQVFKSKVKDRCLYCEYDNPSAFESVFTNALELFLANNWLSEPKPNKAKLDKIELKDKEIMLLKSWIESNDPDAHSTRYKGGTVFFLGGLSYDVTDGHELVEWMDFFNKLENAGFIVQYKYNRQGNPVYQLRAPAYDFIESFYKHEK